MEGVDEALLRKIERELAETSAEIPWCPTRAKRGTIDRRWGNVFNGLTTIWMTPCFALPSVSRPLRLALAADRERLLLLRGLSRSLRREQCGAGVQEGTCLSKIHADFFRVSEDLDFSLSTPTACKPQLLVLFRWN